MDRRFSKDISEYKKDIWKGFKGEELAVMVTTLIIGCIFTFAAVKYLNLSYSDAVYPASIFSAPVIYVYFKKQNGIPLIKVILRKRYLKKTSKEFAYKSSEMKILEIEEKERRLESEKKGNFKRRKLL